jgi:hypothetical protein
MAIATACIVRVLIEDILLPSRAASRQPKTILWDAQELDLIPRAPA